MWRTPVWALAVLLASRATFAGSPNYDTFSDKDGHIRDDQVRAAEQMVQDAAQLESVFAAAKRGDRRAARVFQELETRFFPDIGRKVAERVGSMGCQVPVYRELSGQCIPDWSHLGFLPRSEAGDRLRKAVGDAFTVRAKELGIQNRVIASAVGALLSLGVVGSVVGQAEGRAVAAGAAFGSQAAVGSDLVTLWRALKAEELADLRATGTFRNLGSAEGKYFSRTAEGAVSYARQAVRAWPKDGTYTLVRTEIPKSLLTPEMMATVDQGGIPAVVVPDALLPQLRPTILEPIPAP